MMMMMMMMMMIIMSLILLYLLQVQIYLDNLLPLSKARKYTGKQEIYFVYLSSTHKANTRK